VIHGRPIQLSTSNGALPTSFRIFQPGWNDTTKGRFLFDSAAATSVMQAYRKWGIDLCVDLEHQSLDEAGSDPSARDARGWFKLELKSDGSLWASDVRWTPDGAARLQQKRQRYISPAFDCDPQSKRVTQIINAALVAMPATHNTPALVAASARGKKPMDAGLVKQALDAVEAGDSKAALALLKQLLSSAAGVAPDSDDEDGAEELTEGQRVACKAMGCSFRNFLDARRLLGFGTSH
jgi:phage I-like protein